MMEPTAKEGAGRPLSSPAPVSPANAAAPDPLAALPGPRRVWGWAAVLSYPLAWFYTRVLVFGRGTWPWAVFPLLYMAAVLAMARALGRKAGGNAPFWGACWVLQGLAAALWGAHAGPLGICQGLAWHLTAIYWTLAATGMQAAGRANAMVLLDGVAGLFTLPFGNFLLRLQLLWRGLKGAYRRRAGRMAPDRRHRRWELAAGLVLALLLGGYALGELSAADAGFGALVGRWLRWPRLDDRTLMRLFEQAFYLALSLPVGAWLFGLAGGGLRRKAPPVAEAQVYAWLGRCPRLPRLTARLAVGGLCLVYALFFAVQAAEFAAALGAPVPLTPLEVSTFAVEGFWQLCRILLLNFAVLAAVHFLCPGPADAPGRDRAGLAVFAGFGLAFAALAAAKLGLYIALYGPTPRRILSAWLLLVLGLGCVLALVRLFRRIQAVRITVAVLALSFSLLCCADLEGLCVNVHLDRLAAGQTRTVDWLLLGGCCDWGGREELTARVRDRLRTQDLPADDSQDEWARQDWLWQEES